MAEHYFSVEPGAPAVPRTVSFSAYGQRYTLTSSTGVFSGDRLDLGTSVLLREAPLPDAPGTFLDLGCGYGAIATVLATQRPGSSVWAVDVNTRALELTGTNAEMLGVSGRLHVATPDDVPPGISFDQIWSNPPIRIGKPALHALLERWLPRLVPAGVAWLVVARNLGSDSLQRWLEAEGWAADRHASAKGYRVLRVSRPDPRPADGG